jgi:hypothetical protein
MSEAILSQVIRESAESTQRLLAAAPELARQEVFGLMDFSMRSVNFLQSDWEAVKEHMAAGVESARLQTMIDRVLRGIEAEQRLARLLLEMAERDGPSAKFAEFRLVIQQAESIEQSAGHLLRWLRAPRGPLDSERLEQSLLDFEQGNYESGDDLLTRLQAGGDL